MYKYKLKIIQLVKDKSKMDLSVYDDAFFDGILKKRIENTQIYSHEKYLTFLKNNPDEIPELINSFFIPYSYFFRSPLIFTYFNEVLFPNIINNKFKNEEKELRIWSAGTAAGEEAYSWAMLTDYFMNKINKYIPHTIVGTDSSSSQINKAKEAIYPENKLYNVPQKFFYEYFYQHGKENKIIPRIREMVTFYTFDLLSPETTKTPWDTSYKFDIINCSNILIYYNKTGREAIIKKLLTYLGKGGYLITSRSETEIFIKYPLKQIINSVGIFQKTN